MEELDKRISEIVRSTVKKAREMDIMREILEQGMERSMISRYQETGTMNSVLLYLTGIRGMRE